MIKINLSETDNKKINLYQFNRDLKIEKIEFVKNGEIVNPSLSVLYMDREIMSNIMGIPEDLYKLDLLKSFFSICINEETEGMCVYIFYENDEILRYFEKGEYKYISYGNTSDTFIKYFFN